MFLGRKPRRIPAPFGTASVLVQDIFDGEGLIAPLVSVARNFFPNIEDIPIALRKARNVSILVEVYSRELPVSRFRVGISYM